MPAKTKVRIISRTLNPKRVPEVELEDSNAEEEVDEVDEVEEETKGTDTESVKAKGKVKGDSGAQQILDAFGGVDFLTALVGDTDIQAILTARRAGTKTKVVLDGESGSADTETEEETDAVDEVADELDDDLKKVLKALRTDIRSQLKPLTDEVNALKNIAGTYQKEAVNSQIKTVAKKFKDLPKYNKAMSQLARVHGGLSVMELYILAKSQAGDLRIAEESTESERPTPTPRRRATGVTKQFDTTKTRGRRGFQDVLANALENLEFVEE